MGSDRRGWGVVAGLAVMVLLLDALRVFLPSIIFIFGRAGSTPAATMGLFAAGWFAAGFLALPLSRWLGARTVGVGSAAGLIVARLALLATDGGDPQLYLAGASFVLATWTTVAIAEASADRWPALGAVLALPAAVVMHVGLGTVDPQWQEGATGWILVGLLGLAAIMGTAGMSTTPGDPAVDGEPAPAGFWWRTGVALLLTGIVSGVPAWSVVELSGGRESSRVLALVVLQLVAVAFVLLFDAGQRPGSATASPLRWVSFAVLVAAVAGTLWGVGATIGAPAIAGVSLTVTLFAHSPRRSGDRRREGVGAATGALLMGLVGFVFYAGYDISLGDNRVLLVVATLLLLPRGSEPAVRGPLAGTRPLSGRGAAGATAGVLVLLVAAVLLSPASPAFEEPGPADEVRVAVANIHMGWDTQGRFAIDHIAEDLEALGADVIVLNEVDRGWLLTGGHDTLRLLADRLGLGYVFAPAADRVWGNAILSRLRLDVRQVWLELPREGAPMRRSLAGARLLIDGQPALTIFGTHLHHVEDDDSVRAAQAAAVAQAVRDAWPDTPTVLLGDLNATPGDPALSMLDGLLDDAVAPADPLFTFPSWEPDERIDHILASPSLAISDIERGGSPDSSDHLWLAVTITLP